MKLGSDLIQPLLSECQQTQTEPSEEKGFGCRRVCRSGRANDGIGLAKRMSVRRPQRHGPKIHCRASCAACQADVQPSPRLSRILRIALVAYIRGVYIARELKPNDVRELRRELGLSQSAFARLVGVAPNTVARWERGELGMRPTTARLIELLTTKKRKTK